MPAMPVTDSRRALLSSADAWKRSLIWRSSRARPTKGASSPWDLSEPRRPDTTRSARHSGDRLGLALELERACVLVDDRLPRSPGRVDVADAAPCPGSALDWMRDAVLTRSPATMPSPTAPSVTAASPVSTPARARSPGAELAAERGDGREQVERCAHRSLGVVLRCSRRPPDGHDRVADELLHRPAVHGDDPAADLEVAGEELRTSSASRDSDEGGEADEVGEQDGDEPALGRRLGARRRRRLVRERSPAVAAERIAGLVDRSAGRAAQGERRPAAGAELPARPVLGGARGAVHDQGRNHNEHGCRPRRARCGVLSRGNSAVFPLPASLHRTHPSPPIEVCSW